MIFDKKSNQFDYFVGYDFFKYVNLVYYIQMYF